MTDPSRFLNYGDCVYIHSGEDPKSYLSARSVLEEKVFFIKSPTIISAQPMEDIDSTFYENHSELMFVIYPKLNYEAYKNYTKVKPNEDPFKVQLLKKRLDVENDQNQKFIEKMMSTPVTFGSEIQLYHTSSKSFIRATREKNAINSKLYEIRLSRKGGSGMYLKITPYLTFKKEGEKISLKDFFYLENPKLQASIVYKDIPEFPHRTEASRPQDLERVNHRNYMPLLELSSTFEKFEAGLRQPDPKSPPNPLGVLLVLPHKQSYSSKTLLWGNYVRLKFMLNTKKTGYFYCDNTIIGNSPNVFCRTLNNPPAHERESFQAIFQIVPLSEEQYGSPMEFNDQKEVYIRLRHFLTGRYLEIGAEKGKCALSEPVGTFLEQPAVQYNNDSSPRRTDHSDQIIVRHRNAKILRDRSSFLLKISSPMKKKGVEVMTHTSINANNSPAHSKIRLDDGPESQKMDNDPSAGIKPINLQSGHEDKSPLLPEGYLEVGTRAELQKPSVVKYLEKTWIKLKNVSQDDERTVTVDSVFSLETIKGDENNRPLGSLTVKPKEGKDQKPFSWMTKAAYNDANIQRNFKARFHTRNPLDKEELEALVSAQNDIFFHFSTVNQEEISEIMAVQSKIYPVIKLTSDIETRMRDASPNSKPMGGHGINRAFSLLEHGTKAHDEINKALEKKNKNVIETTESVKKLAVWLSSEEAEHHVGNMNKQVKQKMMRETGVIDNLMDLLIQLFTKNFLKANSKSLVAYKILTRDIFALLQMIIRKNKANNIYVFQWSNLLQNMSLSNTIDNDLGVDKLLSQIFYENIIEINELNDIPDHLNYENYDLKALNIAIALYRYNPVRSMEEKDKIISTLILNDAHRTGLFRKLEKDEQNNYWALGKDGSRIQKIDNSLEYRDKKIFDFSMGVIHLATEITRSKPQVVKSHLDQVLSVELCTDLFENKKWNFLFRSAFLELFTEMYFTVQAIQIENLTFPSKIKFLHTTKVSNQVKDLFESRKEAVLNHFINDRFDIKKFIWDFLSDLHKWTEDEHKYIYSAMKLVRIMCSKGIFNWEELSRLKQTIYQYLKSGLAIIHDEIIPEGRFDKKTTNLQTNTSVKVNKLTSSKLEERQRNYDVDNEDESDQDNIDEEKKEEKTDLYWETVQNDMMMWMQEALKIIEFIEHFELDILQKDFFENEESLKFFNEKLRSGNKSSLHNLEPEILDKIRQDKEAYILRYTNDNFVLQNYKNTILLLEMLAINNITLTTQVVHLIYLNFSRIKDFLSSLDTIELIHQGNIEIFNLFINIYDRLHLSKVQLDSLYGTRRLVKGSEIYQEIDKALSELLASLYKGEDSVIEEEDPEGWNELYEIYDGYKVEKTRGKEKQSILRNLNFFEVVVDLFIQLEKGHYCKVNEARERYLQNYLYFFGFFCVNNPQNQQVMTSNQDFIKALVAIEFPSLQPLLLRVISEMYKDNFSLLIHISQNDNNVITLLLNKFFDKFNSNDATNNEFLIHCLRTFPSFFQIKRIFLGQNQVYFAKKFYAKELEHYKIKRLLTIDLIKFLQNNKVENHVHAEDNLTVKVPFIISFAIYFLNTFARMVEGPIASASAACLKNKYYVSIQDLRSLLREAGDWFNLKLALITFLNHVYIRNKKLEDSEITELQSIVRETMFGEINEYNRFIRNRHLYQRSSRQKFVYSFYNYYSVPSEFKYKATIDEVYHQYILYGIMETFLFYSQRFKNQAPEEDHAILDDYVSSALPEFQEVWDPNPNQKKNFHLDGDITPIKNKMLVPLDEPTDPDIADGDFLVPQLNERKKVAHLKKDIETATKMIKKREKVKDLIVFKKSTASLQPKKTIQEQLTVALRTIESRHNMELEIIVKFLLQMRLENADKFKTAIEKFMGVLLEEDVPIHIKQGALSIIRKLTNFKNDPEIYHAIQIDLVRLKFIDFFDDVTVNAKNEDDKLEFILAMIDFLDDASPLVQRELYETLYANEENTYLETIKKFLLNNFEDFRENERTLTDHKCHYHDITSIVYNMMYRVIYALELLRLSCENHFELMQNHLREQTHANGKNKRSINFINIISDIFSRYIKNLNEKNAILGLRILDTLTEMVQGPCAENQLALCNARILENLQDLIVETSDQRKKKDSVIWTEMNNKVITLILSILEGSNDPSIVSQVCVHINTSSFLERMMEIHYEILKQKKITAFTKHTKKKKTKAAKNANSHGHSAGLAGFEKNLLMLEQYHNKEDDYKVYANEGIQFGIILNTLTHLSPEISKKVTKYKSEVSEEDEGERLKELLKAENYFNKYIGQIEVINKKGDLQRIFFPIVDKTKYLSSVTKMKFLDEVSRDSSNEKLFGLLRYESLFEAEMDHFLRLRKKGLKLSLTFFSRIRDLNLLIAFVTNIIILFGSQITEDIQNDFPESTVSYNNIVRVLGVIHIALCAFALVFWVIFKAPLEIAESVKQFETERTRDEEVEQKKGNLVQMQKILHKGFRQLKKGVFILFDTFFLYLIANLLFALLGALYSKVFFSFLLLDLINRSIILNNVVKSVTVNYKQLLMTVVLGLLIIYVWAVLGFFAVLDGDLAAQNCATVWQCFLYALDQGLRAGGGIGEALGIVAYSETDEFKKRYFYDLLYFVIIIIVLLNIIFGIIIDTFADLRDQKTVKDYDEKNICFICHIDRTLFEKQGKSFEDHTRIEHSLWNYLYYMVYLNTKNKLDYTGTESYVYEKIENEDLSWFPIQRAYMLNITPEEEEEQDVKQIIDEKLEGVKNRIFETIASTTNNLMLSAIGSSKLKGGKGRSKARRGDHKPTYIVNS